jgi:hypothetical protein
MREILGCEVITKFDIYRGAGGVMERKERKGKGEILRAEFAVLSTCGESPQVRMRRSQGHDSRAGVNVMNI